MTIRNKPREAAVFGVDIGKNIFHVVSLDGSGRPVERVRFRRDTLLQFFERATPAIVGLEACPGSQWLARKIQALGHTVRIVPAQFVKPYVNSNKNDLLDAEVIAEAITRPTMRFLEIKSSEQLDMQALHRTRDMMVMHRPARSGRCELSAWSTASRCIRGRASSRRLFKEIKSLQYSFISYIL